MAHKIWTMRIIVGMDFSVGAKNALNYAVDISKIVDVEIQLVWVDSVSGEKQESGQKNEIRHDAKIELQELVNGFSERYPDLKISFKQRKGKVYQEVAHAAQSISADLVIIGTHGINGFEEFWVGSNAYKIISYCPCPVISVRANYSKGCHINKIVLPIDHTIDTTQKVAMAAKLANYFDAEVDVLGVYDSPLSSIKKKTESYIIETERFLTQTDVKTNIHFCNSNNISSSVVTYAEKNDADLIVIMTDQNKANSDIVMGRNSQIIINQSSIPVLSVKPSEMKFEQ